MTKRGNIDYSQRNIEPEEHELHTAKVFASFGHNVTFIAASNIPGIHKGDFYLDNNKSIIWEAKAPSGTGSRTIENNFDDAHDQSKYIVIDLFRGKLPEVAYINRIITEFQHRKYIKWVKIITKNNSKNEDEKIIDLKR